MRLSNLLLPLVLLLTIGSVYAEHPLIGTWTDFAVEGLYSHYCCIPRSIQIVKAENTRLNATYNYGGNNEKCSMMFDTVMSSDNKAEQLAIWNMTNDKREKYMSDMTKRGDLQFDYKVIYSNGNFQLNIFTTDGIHDHICNITMRSRSDNVISNTNANIKSNNLGAKTDFRLLGLLIAFCVIVVALYGFRRHQKRKASAIAEQMKAPFAPNGSYVQLEAPYAAPNQFPNTQA